MNEHSTALTRRAFVGGAAVLGASAALLSWNPTQAFGATAAEKKAEAAAALDKLDSVNAKLNQAEYDFEMASYEQEQAKAAMDEAQGRIDEATARIGDLQDQLGTRAKSMYRTGSTSFLDLLLGATTFQAFTQNWGILNDMNESDAQMVQETKDLRVEVEEQKAVYAEQEQQAAKKAAEAEEVKNSTEALQSEMQATYNSLSAEAAALVAAEEAARQQAAEAAAANGTIANTGTNTRPNTSSKPNNNNTSSGDNLPVIGGSDAISRAYSCIGIPYVSGGGGPKSFDCSGFVSYCLTGQTGRKLGTTVDMASYPNVSKANAKAGDIVWWNGHVGLYVGGGMMVHASLSKGKVVEAAVSWCESGLGTATYKRYR